MPVFDVAGGVQFQVKSYQDYIAKGDASALQFLTYEMYDIHIYKCDLLMRLIMSSQMADCGGLPQVVQVGFFVCLFVFKLSRDVNVILLFSWSNTIFYLFFLLQPGKLAEAFKYFVQGMGYSK